ncbi:MAG: hypothetical protein HY904_05925 [Deltaproteobacteria bacterium]|nr:hypothetical protein [Deltaproteobacteria bacterium]
MDELYVLSAEAQAIRTLGAEVEADLAGGRDAEAARRVRDLAVIWHDALVVQEARVLQPSGVADVGLPHAEVERARHIGLRLMEAVAGAGAPGFPHAAVTRGLIAEMRAHAELLAERVLPVLYARSSEEERWELARALDRTLDDLGRSRWQHLVLGAKTADPGYPA